MANSLKKHARRIERELGWSYQRARTFVDDNRSRARDATGTWGDDEMGHELVRLAKLHDQAMKGAG